MKKSLMIAALLLAATVQANAVERDGLSASLSLGVGVVDEGLDGSNDVGGVVNFEIGGFVNPNVFVGVNTNAWAKKDNIYMSSGYNVYKEQVSVLVNSYHLVTSVYLGDKSNFFLKGGLGASQTAVKYDAGEATISVESNLKFSGLIGAGYDLNFKRSAVTFQGGAIIGDGNALASLSVGLRWF